MGGTHTRCTGEKDGGTHTRCTHTRCTGEKDIKSVAPYPLRVSAWFSLSELWTKRKNIVNINVANQWAGRILVNYFAVLHASSWSFFGPN